MRPHPGRQELFLSTSADVAVYGGLAGCGKSWALLMQWGHFLAHDVPASGIIFRRSDDEIDKPGGLNDQARELYEAAGARCRQHPRDYSWKMSRGQARVEIHSLVKESDVFKYQGTQFDFIGFDEATHFTKKQIFYLISRRRSAPRPGVRVAPFVRMTCNPTASGWLRDMVDWWLDETPGGQAFAREDRVGVIRWFAVVDDPSGGEELVVWGDSAEEITEQYPSAAPLSFTFIAGRRDDNPSLDWAEYDKSLANLPAYERRALREGDWNAAPEDPGKVWTAPPAAFFRDTDAEFRALLDAGTPVDVLGGWDYGRGRKALAWICGALEPGAVPRLWVFGCRVWTRTAPAAAAASRSSFLQTNGLPFNVTQILDAGDPSGWAADSGEGWARELSNAGVPMVDIRHVMGTDRQPKYWNAPAGRDRTLDLVQGWFDNGRLRIRVCADTAVLITAIREWRLDIPEGVRPEAVNRDLLSPRKDEHSHPGDALRYLVAFAASVIAGRRPGGPGKPQGQEMPPARPGHRVERAAHY